MKRKGKNVKRTLFIVTIIMSIVLVLLGIFLLAIYPKIKQNTSKKQFDAEEIENREQIEEAKQNETQESYTQQPDDAVETDNGEQIEATKQNEAHEPYTLQPDDLTQIGRREKAAEEFKKIMGIDIPNGVTINRIFLEDDGYLMIDLVFHSQDYDSVFQTIRDAADNRLPLVFQNEEIYDPDLPNVFEYGWEEQYFELFPESTGQIHPIIEWYIDEPESKSGAITGFTALTLLKTGNDDFHIIFQND